jgi:hypothetical protein
MSTIPPSRKLAVSEEPGVSPAAFGESMQALER